MTFFKTLFLLASTFISSENLHAQANPEKSENAEKTVIAEKILGYSWRVLNADVIFERLTQKNIEKYPYLGKIANEVKSNFSIDELSKLQSREFIDYISNVELNDCARFIDSDLGKSFAEASKTASFKQDPNSYFNTLNPENSAEISNFFASKCILMNTQFSKRGQEIYAQYLQGLNCDATKIKSKRLYKRLVSDGFCKS